MGTENKWDNDAAIQQFVQLSEETTSARQALTDSSGLLEQSSKMLESQIEALMVQWERKHPVGMLAKEYVTIGKGPSRIVVCTNPLLKDKDATYLILAHRGPYMLTCSYYHNVPEPTSTSPYKIIDYVSSPFKGLNPPPSPASDDTRNLLFFHTYLRGQKPGSQMRLVSGVVGGNVGNYIEIRNLESKIGMTTYGEGTAFGKVAYPLGFESALLLYQGIQDRVEAECMRKLEEIENSTDKNRRRADVIKTLLGQNTADKLKRKFFGK